MFPATHLVGVRLECFRTQVVLGQMGVFPATHLFGVRWECFRTQSLDVDGSVSST